MYHHFPEDVLTGMGILRAVARRVGKTWVIHAMGGIVSLGFAWMVGRGIDWGESWGALLDLPPHVVILALIVFLLSNVARAFRWRLLFVHEHISVVRLFVIENIGLGVNNLLPVRIAGEAIQFTLLTLRDGVSRGTAVVTLAMGRIMDIWASSLLMAIGFLLVPGGRQLARYAVGGLVLSILLLALSRFLIWGSARLPIVDRIYTLRSFKDSAVELERERIRIFVSLAVSLIQWVLLGISGWIVAGGMDITLSLVQAVLLILATVFVATSVPALPGAIGTFEVAMVYIIGLFDVDKSMAFPYAVVMHLVLFLPSSIMAVVLMPREGIGSLLELRSRFQGWGYTHMKDHS